ncbi:hypothetical protein P280DRAFT_141237 [Massarina eburnea CBS 473.64]|uniref:Uncharacterized protein n=1 Tax=Massarina eburnea CBS 473.64 TaxID=1395130 RepID=A0A6A6RNE8_9PLEO|nr:hypothetical protein P280DRAFT_141237 [Massarina eburnea CBS 473.64]
MLFCTASEANPVHNPPLLTPSPLVYPYNPSQPIPPRRTPHLPNQQKKSKKHTHRQRTLHVGIPQSFGRRVSRMGAREAENSELYRAQ